MSMELSTETFGAISPAVISIDGGSSLQPYFTHKFSRLRGLSPLINHSTKSSVVMTYMDIVRITMFSAILVRQISLLAEFCHYWYHISTLLFIFRLVLSGFPSTSRVLPGLPSIK